MSARGLAERIAHLTPEQRELYLHRKRKLQSHKPQPNLIRKREGEGPWPASVDQAALWFFHQLDPDNYGYNIGNGYLVRGDLDILTFERAVNAMTDRHEILRTVFAEINGAPFQVIKPRLRVEVQVMDMRAIPEPDRDAAALRALTAWIKKPFDLAHGPLLRMPVALLDADRRAISFVLHHAVTDWWSYQIYYTEIFALYRAIAKDRPFPLEPLPVQYADYAYWRNQWQRTEDFQRQLDYWREKLADAPKVLEIPTDLPRPAKQRFDGARCYFQVGELATAQFRRLNRERGMTSVMTMLAAVFAFIHRYAGVDDMLVGMAATNRDNPRLENMIGYLLNILVLRGDLRGEPSFGELLGQVKQTMLEAFDNKDLPFRYLVEHLNPERDASRTPIYQIEYVHVTSEGPSIQEKQHLHSATDECGLAIEGYNIDREICANDLQITFGEGERDIMLLLEYNTSLYLEETIERMGGLLIAFMARLARDADTPISRLPLLSASQASALLADLNDTARDYPRDRSLAALFEARAAAAPDGTALLTADDAISFGQLNARANRVAAWLIERGLNRGEPVGLCLEPGFDLVVAILGVLKAGGAYLPLDPAHPQERLALTLQDAGATAVIAQNATLDALPAYELNFLNALVLEEEAEALAALSPDNPDRAAPANAPAYIIYTSGSTGAPKGVVVPQRAVLRLALNQNFLAIGPHDVLVLASSVSFDASTLELWGALLNGAALVLTPARAVDRLPEVIAAHGVTVLWLTAQLFHAMVDQHLAALGRLRVLLAGGDALSPDHVRRFLQACPKVRLINGYGPTENTTFTCCADLSDTGLTPRSAPIGRPIANTDVYIVNRRFSLQPVNAVGELCAGGDGLAAGYLGQPALTAQRFTPNPWSDRPGQRLYRTGDLARLTPSGQIEFHGRYDAQVKIRGFRVEPGEIETALRKRADVAQAFVTARAGDRGDKRLVAYVKAEGEPPAPEDLRDQLRQWLPEHMIPSAFVAVAEFPLKPSGKIDVRALPAPDAVEIKKEHRPPQNQAEAVLAEVWREALDLPRVGVADNFFDLGGDSLLAIQILAQAREKGLELTLQKMFETPTIAELCRGVDLGEAAHSAALAPFALLDETIRGALPDSVENAYPMSRSQLGMVFHGDYEESSAIYHTIVNYRAQLPVSPAALRQALDLLAQRHEILRTSFEPDRYGPSLQLVHRRVRIPLEIGAGSTDAEALAAWTARQRNRPFDWSRPPLIHVFIHPIDEDGFYLSFSFHHAILDGWSESLLSVELLAAYRALLTGDTPDPGPQPPPYARFIALEQAALGDPRSRDYWRSRIEDAEPTPLPPFASAGEPAPSPKLRYRSWLVEEPLARRLNELCRQLGAPLKSALLAAHLKAVSVITGRDDLVTGLAANGRPEEVGGDRTLGLFINTLPLRFQLPDVNWSGLILAAFAAETERLPHRLFPLTEIQEIAGGARLFETAFNYTHFHARDTMPDSDDAAVIPVSGFAKSSFPLLANFDLQVHGKRPRLQLECHPERASERQADRYFAIYRHVIETMARQPDQRHHATVFLDEQDRAAYASLNQTQSAFPSRAAHRLFEEIAAARPQAQALQWQDGAMTYGQLNAQANRLARLLRDRGAGPDRIVGLCADGSARTVVALLAILKSGAAYLPFDPTYPANRVQGALADAGAVTLVHRRQWPTPLDDVSAPLFDLDKAWDRLAGQNDGDLETAVAPENLAYVIYTSGSTGAPKGVAVTHRNVVRLVRGADYARFAQDEVFLRAASIAFDASTFEIWGALLNGAILALAPDDEPARLAAFIREAGVTTLWMTAQLFNLMVDEHLDDLAGARRLLAGGEALSVEHVARFLAAHPQNRLINGYGPTESVTFACCCDLREHGLDPASAPIGRPIANTSAYLLDAALNPVPAGTAGELYLGGAGLARGYLNRPALTAERFIPCPFAGEGGAGDGSRLYRTGDRVRLLANGLLDFTGRVDRQVKLRGYRVELGEIEHALRRSPLVKDAAVRLWGDSPAAYQIAAYAVPEDADLALAPPDGQGPETQLAQRQQAIGALREFLSHELPDYMAPAAILFLGALPRTANQKIDYRSLPAPEEADLRGESAYEPPVSETERTLAELYAEQLKLAKVGRHDHFFNLGGHSLLATRLIAKLKRQLEISLPIRVIFEHPVLRDLASQVDLALWSAKQKSEPDLGDDAEEGEI